MYSLSGIRYGHSSEKRRPAEIWLSIFDASARFFLDVGVTTASTTSNVSGATTAGWMKR